MNNLFSGKSKRKKKFEYSLNKIIITLNKMKI